MHSRNGVIFTHLGWSDIFGVTVIPPFGVRIVASVSLQIWSELYYPVFTVFTLHTVK